MSRLQEVVRRFQDALARALPDLSRKEPRWLMHYLIGAMFRTDMEQISGGPCNFSDIMKVLKLFLAFGVTRLRAPESGGHEVTGGGVEKTCSAPSRVAIAAGPRQESREIEHET
jgi:hypothetical protein